MYNNYEAMLAERNCTDQPRYNLRAVQCISALHYDVTRLTDARQCTRQPFAPLSHQADKVKVPPSMGTWQRPDSVVGIAAEDLAKKIEAMITYVVACSHAHSHSNRVASS
eukprot:SAG31_NODE_435_length_15733_cov_6.508251_2_plen_110_part_00